MFYNIYIININKFWQYLVKISGSDSLPLDLIGLFYSHIIKLATASIFQHKLQISIIKNALIN